MSEIIYGIRGIDGKIISIDEVPDNMIGLSCGCVCASCGRTLQACSLHGKVRRYFRHDHDSEDNGGGRGNVHCSPNAANETALHQMAKQIIAEEKRVFVPHKNISFFEAGIKDIPEEIKRRIPSFEYQKAMMIYAESAVLENRLESFTPDVMLKTKRGELLIEIFVSHQVDDDKRERARAYGSAMLEIDLSRFAQTPITTSDLRKIILDNKENKKWIYYPLTDDAISKAKGYYENTEPIKQYRQEIFDELQRKQKEEFNRNRRHNKIKHLFEPETYAAELKRLHSDALFFEFYEKNGKSYWFGFDEYYKKNGEVPFFVNVPITGEIIFQCDRKIWQSALFNRFIYSRKEVGAKFNIDNLFSVLKDDFHINVDFDLSYKLLNPLDEKKVIWLRKDVISKYMDYLETIGFIITPNHSRHNRQCDWKTVKATKTIDPPNKRAAEQLVSAMQRVDICSPDIDHLIDEEMNDYYVESHQEEMEERERIAAEQFQHYLESCIKEELEMQREAQEMEEKRKAQQLAHKKLEKERRQQRYNNGLQDVESLDFFESKNIYDRYGERWVKCSCCNCIKRADEMISYKFGTGECRECRKSSK